MCLWWWCGCQQEHTDTDFLLQSSTRHPEVPSLLLALSHPPLQLITFLSPNSLAHDLHPSAPCNIMCSHLVLENLSLGQSQGSWTKQYSHSRSLSLHLLHTICQSLSLPRPSKDLRLVFKWSGKAQDEFSSKRQLCSVSQHALMGETGTNEYKY